MVVDKPEGFTSFDVIAKLRGVLKTRRIGHSGTLDPMATGVLPLFIGSATKAVDMHCLLYTSGEEITVVKVLACALIFAGVSVVAVFDSKKQPDSALGEEQAPVSPVL